MAFRTETRTGALLILLTAASLGAEHRYEAWHGHSRPPHIKRAGEMGDLVFTDAGVSFTGPKGKHAWRWDYTDIQQLKISPKSLTVLTYQDNKWKFGADREYHFDLPGNGDFTQAYTLLKDKLDQRFVAALPDRDVRAAWEIPVKHLHTFGGSHGVLMVGEDRIVYRSGSKGESRTWRLADIENVSSAGPFELTLTTYERAKSSYGSLKALRFQLKQRLDETRYNDLWREVNRAKGLWVLTAYQDKPRTEVGSAGK